MDILSTIFDYGMTILLISIPAIVVIGLIVRLVRARRRGTPARDEARHYIGSGMNMIDPLTGVPRTVVDKNAVIEYVEDHFEDGRNDETGIYGQDKDAY
jgi:hypothetical protein